MTPDSGFAHRHHPSFMCPDWEAFSYSDGAHMLGWSSNHSSATCSQYELGQAVSHMGNSISPSRVSIE